MLSYLSGVIESKEMGEGHVDRLVLDVSGIGFELSVSRRTLLLLGQVGEKQTVHAALVIRENDWIIFGFAHKEEKEMFALVQSVTGVGPKLALALVGTLSAETLADAVAREDHKLIAQTPGVGPKLAQRLILELKSKVETWQRRHVSAQGTKSGTDNQAYEAVRDILEGLGYTPTEINTSLKEAAKDGTNEEVEVLVRACLKVLGAAKA